MNEKREASIEKMLKEQYLFDETTSEIKKLQFCCDRAILHLIKNDDIENSMHQVKVCADWFDFKHPEGSRDPKGECDFIAIRIIMALYEKECFDRLSDEVKASLERFFTKRDFSSIYGSENHSLMYRVTRLLAAQFYKNAFFDCFGQSAKDIYDIDSKYIHDFLDFRAKRGWGEFDSLGYAFEIMLILSTLHKYTDDKKLKNKAHMSMDIIMLDMIADCVNGMYAGAHGRSYPPEILDRSKANMTILYNYYFDDNFTKNGYMHSLNILLSDYVPSDIVYMAAKKKPAVYENRERKHLHCCSAWMGDINWDILNKANGSISKYTYICGEYALGGINRQDDYPQDLDDSFYAHHQQHEWELTFPDDGEMKIFTHHRAIPDYHHQVNRWTGDIFCCCGSFYTNSNTALCMYDIPPMNKKDVPTPNLPLINAYVPLHFFDTVKKDDKYLFLGYKKLYISLYFDNGYVINDEDNFADKELLSLGSKNAFVLRVAYKENYKNISDFAEQIKATPVLFDRKKMTVEFDGIMLRKEGNSENGKENIYPYAKLYDCPFMKSDWDSGIIEVTIDNKKVIYDFTKNEICEKNN